MPRGHLRRGQSAHSQFRAVRIPRCGQRFQRIVSADPFLARNPKRFRAQPMAVDQRGATFQRLNDVRELLLRPVGTQNLVETEQVGRVGYALQLVAVAGEAQSDLAFGRIAWLPDARTSGHV